MEKSTANQPRHRAAIGAWCCGLLLTLLVAPSALAANVNPAGAALNLTGSAYWSHTVQENAAGARVVAVGTFDEGAALTNARNAVATLNPLNLLADTAPGSEGEGSLPEGEGLLPEGEGFTPEGEGFLPEGEGLPDGEGFAPGPHTADQDQNFVISLSELLRVIQFFNSGGLHCVEPPQTSEDGYLPGANPDAEDCTPHASDYNPQDWVISLSELLRLIQFFNTGGYFACPDAGSEDGYCPGAPPATD